MQNRVRASFALTPEQYMRLSIVGKALLIFALLVAIASIGQAITMFPN